jgi:HK97 family phage portal protein
MNVKDFIPPVFARKSQEVSKLIYKMFSNRASWTPQTFENLAAEGFNKNVWVYRCIMLTASSVSRVPWLLYKRLPDGTLEEITDHPLLDLMRKPNHMQSGQEFREALIAYMLLSGNTYAAKVGPAVGPPRELWTLRPDRVEVLPDARNYVSGFKYSLSRNDYTTYKREQVMHLKNFAALDDYYGLSPIAVAARGIDADNAANEWNTGLLQNGGRPSGAMVTEQTLSDPQYERLTKVINDKYSGAKNAGRPMLLEGGLKWQEMSLSPKDMDFVQNKKTSLKEIAAAFSTPPELLGDSDNKTYSNYKEARFAFYMETILPALDKVADKFNAELVPDFGDTSLFLAYDKEAIDALKDSVDALFTRVFGAVDRGLLTINESREAMGYEAVSGGDVRYIRAGMIPEGDYSENPPDEEPGQKGAGFPKY